MRGRQVHAEWGWLATGGASELDWWLYAASWSPSPPLCLHNGHLRTQGKNKRESRTHIHTVQIYTHTQSKTYMHVYLKIQIYSSKHTI